MKLPEFIRMFDPGHWAALAGAVALLILIVFVMGKCSRNEEINKANADQSMAEARTQSAAEAITEMGALNDRGVASDQQVQEAQNAIRQADPADRDRIARLELCRLQSRPDCDRL
ncbi:MAG: hypothetical protein V7672_00665 [Brevundimonas sp.]|uniref:hypothetical protein n=1 Tax=Brevundimonas sp. TaxID=1871086 RepID=UPI0030039971